MPGCADAPWRPRVAVPSQTRWISSHRREIGRLAEPVFQSMKILSISSRISDRKVERVATLDVPNGLIGYWNGWMSTTPDGIPLLLRDLEIEEIYTLDVGLP